LIMVVRHLSLGPRKSNPQQANQYDDYLKAQDKTRHQE